MVNSEFDHATVSNLFYNNRLELLRKLQKTFVVEDLHNTQSNACILQQWTDYYYREVVKAIYGHGKYRLAPGSEIFYNNKPGVSQKFLVWAVRTKLGILELWSRGGGEGWWPALKAPNGKCWLFGTYKTLESI